MSDAPELPIALLAPPIEPETAVELVWSPGEDYRRRLLGRVHPAEACLVASRMTTDTATQIAGPEEVETTRAAFLSQYTNAVPLPGEARPLDPEHPLDRLLISVLQDAPSHRALFGCDLLVVTSSQAAVLRPAAGMLWRRTLMSPLAIDQFRAACGVDLEQAAAFVLVGVPWRYMQLLGPRALQRCLADVGTVAATLERGVDGIGTSWMWEFMNVQADAALEYDGLERSVMAIGTVNGGGRHA